MSKQRYMLLVFVLCAAAAGMTVQAATVSIFAQFAFPDSRLLGLINTSSALALVTGIVTFVVMMRSHTAGTFTREVVGELLRVTWPSRDEAVRASTTVVLTTLMISGLMAVLDFTWKNLADLVLFTER